jgi:dethiobiotin synthetase
MPSPIFITGIGTDVGKTLVAAIVTEALEADYWKPVQAGLTEGTDAEKIRSLLSNPHSKIHPEAYRLQTPASPHIAARIDGVEIDPEKIVQQGKEIQQTIDRPLLIEGAGGLLVPISAKHTVADLIKPLQARVILVSRNYLGSINHSLLTAAWCRNNGIDVAGWIFNDDYLQYEDEIVGWSGYPSLGRIARMESINAAKIREQALLLKPVLSGTFGS